EARPQCATSRRRVRLFPIAGALPNCGTPSAFEVAPAPHSDGTKCLRPRSDWKTRRILLVPHNHATKPPIGMMGFEPTACRHGHLVPNQALYQAEPQPENKFIARPRVTVTSRILIQIARTEPQGVMGWAAVPVSRPLRSRPCFHVHRSPAEDSGSYGTRPQC